MSCRFCEKRFSNYLDGRLASDETQRFEAHLAECEACRGELTRYRRFQGAMAAQPALSVPSGLTTRVMANLPSEAPKVGLFEWLQQFARIGAPAASLVALLLLALLFWRQPEPPTQVQRTTTSETSMFSESMIESGDADDDELTGFVINPTSDEENDL